MASVCDQPLYPTAYSPRAPSTSARWRIFWQRKSRSPVIHPQFIALLYKGKQRTRVAPPRAAFTSHHNPRYASPPPKWLLFVGPSTSAKWHICGHKEGQSPFWDPGPAFMRSRMGGSSCVTISPFRWCQLGYGAGTPSLRIPRPGHLSRGACYDRGCSYVEAKRRREL